MFENENQLFFVMAVSLAEARGQVRSVWTALLTILHVLALVADDLKTAAVDLTGWVSAVASRRAFGNEQPCLALICCIFSPIPKLGIPWTMPCGYHQLAHFISQLPPLSSWPLAPQYCQCGHFWA